MKELNVNTGGHSATGAGDGGMHHPGGAGQITLDPSQISLFPGPSSNDGPSTSHSFVTNSSAFSPDAFAPSTPTSPTARVSGVIPDVKKAYQPGRTAEVQKRKVLIDRMRRTRDTGGVVYNVPQLEESTETIQSMFVRRMRKQASLKQHLSTEIMRSIFEEESTRPSGPTSHQQHHHPPTIGAMLDLHHHHYQRSGPGVIPVSEVVGSDDEGGRGRARDDDYDEVTEASTDDDGEADAAMEVEAAASSGKHRHTGVDLSRRLRFYIERKRILQADLRARILQKKTEDSLAKWRYCLVRNKPEPFKFPQPAPQETMTAARCRPLLNRPRREIVHWTFPRHLNGHTPIGPQEFSQVDDAIHSTLTDASAVRMERRAQRYLADISQLPVEVMRKKHRTRRIVEEREGKKSHAGFSLRGDFAAQKKRYLKSRKDRGGQRDASPDSDAEDKSRPLKHKFRLPIGHHLKPRPQGGGSPNKPTGVTGNRRGRKPKNHPASESRRQSIAPGNEFGASAFDYDASLMDMGLPPLQHVDYQEITVPQFRDKDVLQNAPSKDSEAYKNYVNPVYEIARAHHEMEHREKHRFKMTRRMAELRKTSASGSNSTAASAFESGPAVIPPFDEAGFAARRDLDDLTVPWYDRPSKAAPYPPRPFLIHGEMVAARAAERPPRTEEPPQRRASEDQPAVPVRAEPARPSSTASRRSSASATATRPTSRDASLARHPSQASESSKPSTPKPQTPRPMGVGPTASSAPSLRTTPSPSLALLIGNRPPTSMSTPGSSSFASPAAPPFNNSSLLSSSLAFSSFLSSSADENGYVPVLSRSGEVKEMIRLDDDPKSLSESSSSSSDDDDAESPPKKPRSSLPTASGLAMATASSSTRMPPPAAPKQTPKPLYKHLSSSSSTSPTTSESESELGAPAAKKPAPNR